MQLAHTRDRDPDWCACGAEQDGLAEPEAFLHLMTNAQLEELCDATRRQQRYAMLNLKRLPVILAKYRCCIAALTLLCLLDGHEMKVPAQLQELTPAHTHWCSSAQLCLHSLPATCTAGRLLTSPSHAGKLGTRRPTQAATLSSAASNPR